MKYSLKKFYLIRKNQTFGRIVISLIPWILLGLFSKIFYKQEINFQFGNPIDWSILIGLLVAFSITIAWFTLASDLLTDNETKVETTIARSILYEDLSSTVFSIAGGLIFLLVSERSNISGDFLLLISISFYLFGVILLKASRNLQVKVHQMRYQEEQQS